MHPARVTLGSPLLVDPFPDLASCLAPLSAKTTTLAACALLSSAVAAIDVTSWHVLHLIHRYEQTLEPARCREPYFSESTDLYTAYMRSDWC